MRKKKVKIILLSVAVLASIFFCSSGFAEQVANTDSMQQNNMQIADNPVSSDASVEQNREMPAIELNKRDEDKEKHLVPVLELKGGIKSEKIPEEEKSALRSWLEGDYFTSDWAGLRTKLEDHGITFAGSYMSDSFQKFRGGLNGKDHFKTFGVVDTSLTLDTKKMGLWSGGKLLVRFQNKHGLGLLRDYIGDINGTDAYDYRRFAQISEYWYEQGLWDDHIKVKLGKQDANFDFLVLGLAQNFINNSTAYFMPNIPLPSYPEPAMGAVITLQPLSWFSIKSGFYDGNAKGGTSGFDTTFGGNKSTFFIEEAGITHSLKNHPGNYLAGYWLKTANKDELSNADDCRTFGQSYGWYMEGEQMLWKENKDVEDDQGLTFLGQFSWAPSDRSEVTRYYGTALLYKGLIPKRDNDVVGIGTANAKLSGRLKDIEDDGRYGSENVLEMFYKIQLTSWLVLQPDIQFIFHPSGQYKSAFVMGLRTLITF